MKREIALKLHSMAGLLSGIFILVMSVSGSLLVFHDELDEVQQPDVAHHEDKSVMLLDSVYGIVMQHYPQAAISHCILPGKPTAPVSFFIYDASPEKNVEALEVFIDPQKGSILGTRKGSGGIQKNFVGWLSSFHNSFHLGKPGEWLLGFFSIMFLFSLLTGSLLYRKNIIAVLAFRKSVLNRKNLHQIVGVYALLFNLMIGTTGFWMQRYVFKTDFYSNQAIKHVVRKPLTLSFGLEKALALVKEKFPNFTARVMYFPVNHNGNTVVYGSRTGNSFIHSKQYADVIFLDSSGNISRTAFVQDIDAGSRFDIINAQVHYGRYGGLPVKVLYCILGLSGGLLSITGFILLVRRKKIVQ